MLHSFENMSIHTEVEEAYRLWEGVYVIPMLRVQLVHTYVYVCHHSVLCQGMKSSNQDNRDLVHLVFFLGGVTFWETISTSNHYYRG